MSAEPGSVYEDDLSIPDPERLFRMVNNRTVERDHDTVRATTAAFRDPSASRLQEQGYPAVAVSVFLESEMEKHDITPADLRAQWGHEYGLVSITAGQARQQGQGVIRAARPDNPAHGMIFAKTGTKKTKGQSRALARHSVIVIAPPPLVGKRTDSGIFDLDTYWEVYSNIGRFRLYVMVSACSPHITTSVMIVSARRKTRCEPRDRKTVQADA